MLTLFFSVKVMCKLLRRTKSTETYLGEAIKNIHKQEHNNNNESQHKKILHRSATNNFSKKKKATMVEVNNSNSKKAKTIKEPVFRHKYSFDATLKRSIKVVEPEEQVNIIVVFVRLDFLE